MARLYADENFPFPVIEELRRLGHDVLTSLEAGNANRSVEDDIVLEYAVTDGRAVLTINRKHFLRLHRRGVVHAGILAGTLDPNFVGQANRIHDALLAEPDVIGRLLRINRPG